MELGRAVVSVRRALHVHSNCSAGIVYFLTIHLAVVDVDAIVILYLQNKPQMLPLRQKIGR